MHDGSRSLSPPITTLALAAAALALAAMVLALPAEAHAQRSRCDNRVLAGHPFIPSFLVGQPFNTRMWGMSTGVGVMRGNVTGVDWAIDLADLNLSMMTQQPIVGPLAVRAFLEGQTLVGTNLDTAIAIGAFGIGDGGGGVLVNFFTRRAALSASIDVSVGRGYNLSAYNAVEKLDAALESAIEQLEQGQLPDPDSLDVSFGPNDLTTHYYYLDVGPSLTFGLGLFEWMGLYAEVAYDYQRQIIWEGSTDYDHEVTPGIGLSFNFDPYKVPLGINLAFQRAQNLQWNEASVNSVETGLYYAGGEHFAAGASAVMRFAERDEAGFQSYNYGVQIGMAYYE